MNEEIKSPVQLMADLLGQLAERVAEAERQRDEASRSSDEWYQHWQTKDAQLKETEAKLAKEIEEHQSTRQALREALYNMQKGAQKNG